MFGMGITEILLIAIVAVIALGPEKLPDAMVKIARLFNSVKKGLNDAKTTLDKELNISELKEEANKFKAQIEETKASLNVESNFDLGLDDILKDDLEVKKDSLKVEDSKKELENRFAKANENKTKNEKNSLDSKEI
ncbi:Sec-independent protein translocase protein TatB [Aliarcobacter thereius]|uniref:Sec-independent protein translocase protein TatB homolog n=3 Tax=Aliarcobacter thereius TaxID=544718 RepID=A0A1C0B6S3_9BACT|nr:Sec-independent protein translocase protein TatB [Aliarcobacter thereius]OCL87003.1 Sec-independent protein translocase protein TatB [Aliarcobacter thereius]OCL91186.1 Sec-independent protein translocase protein TatB [Aliarcobacter thereius]OCL95963.1 Sec-independent protein translocase protein TatB [Aliarcobacter thereius LMG 24486]OCL99288.1 Sec-independent protein translocase protein TatB [Aliarcobacter thereius]QBF16065.1 twin arginine translocation system, TatB protein [Aliarcobacter t